MREQHKKEMDYKKKARNDKNVTDERVKMMKDQLAEDHHHKVVEAEQKQNEKTEKTLLAQHARSEQIM